ARDLERGREMKLLHGAALALLLLAAAAHAQRTPRTHAGDAAALNAVFAKLGQKASSSWNISGNLCTGAATDDTDIDNDPNFNPAIKCLCSTGNASLCRITRLKIYALDAVGPIPEELWNLTSLTNLSLGINALSGPLPKELGNLTNLVSLGIGSNKFNGSLPSELGNLAKLEQMYIDSAGLTGPLPASLSKLTKMKILWASDNDFTGQIPDYIGSWSLTELRFQGNSFEGPIPATLSNLAQLTSLRIGDILNGSSSSLAFVNNMTSLSTLVLRNCRISDKLSSIDFSKLTSLNLLDLSFNNITGQVPQTLLNLKLLNFLDFSYNQLSGTVPSWAKDSQLNLVTNNFVADSSSNSVLPTGWGCLQRNTPCFLGSPQSSSFAVDSGSRRPVSGSDNSFYESDDASLGPASFYVTGAQTWGVSNVGRFMDAQNGSYIIYSSRQFLNTLDTELFRNARMSPSSLRYFGIGLENGNYTVTLQFAEFDFPDGQSWKSTGRRVFDIYVQGVRKEQNFDIRKTAGGKSYTAVRKQYIVPVTKNFLEIHLFWAGKGTCCIPTQGYYGPAISALSATPNFTPTVRNAAAKKNGSKTGMIVGVIVGLAVLGLVAFAAIFVWRQKKRKLSLEQEELYSIVGRPNVLSYGELRSATDNFSPDNLLGQGGYGSVYKGKLTDGRFVAVKQLSEKSHQGKREFATEIETISRVQHRKGKSSLDWPTRFEICLGVARGLSYLHEESSIRVVHRDIKASNILLDANLNPKISDFGLAKLYDDQKTHVSTKVAGTFGYLAPEYAMRGHMTEKIDVFAFGVVVLETLAGRPNYSTKDENKVYIFEWVWELYEDNRPLDVVDPRLEEFDSEEVLRAIKVALLCTQGSPHQRPPMSRVVAMLTGDVEAPDVVTKPSYITEWQIKGGNTSYMSTDVSGQSSSAPRPNSSTSQTSSPFLSSVI
uniref:non-specific serine/threonine protein kinase n=1 Tax=Aegilops tauschii subsp. strangulata TaxID=200361 RepID=A0A453CQF1_AEGTS